jgi:hypothetical protein
MPRSTSSLISIVVFPNIIGWWAMLHREILERECSPLVYLSTGMR